MHRWSSGQIIPWETFHAFDLSLGKSEDEIRQRYETTHDHRLTYRGVTAYAGASHWQFTAYKAVMRSSCPSAWTAPWGRCASSTSA